MLKSNSKTLVADSGLLEIKSKFAAEFRRISIPKSEATNYETFKNLIEDLHKLKEIPFTISYTDPSDNDLLPINNDDNLARALLTARPLLRLHIQRKGESLEELNGYGTFKPRNLISTILGGTPGKSKSYPSISNPHDFRKVSAIIDVDVVPEAHRRVRLLKHGSDKPLGFYIRDGTSVRVTPSGLEKMPGIFISRLVPGGLAESTGLLAVNDEVLEVNGIDVAGKTLDQVQRSTLKFTSVFGHILTKQSSGLANRGPGPFFRNILSEDDVTDMMVANSSNLVVTVKPANQRTTMAAPRRGSFSRASQNSNNSNNEEKFEEEDIVVTY